MRAPSPGQEDPRRRAWQPSPVFLPGESMDRRGWRATVGPQRVQHDGSDLASMDKAAAAAAAAKSLQSCPTLCDPIDGSP